MMNPVFRVPSREEPQHFPCAGTPG